ncbi:TetR family transcriptional regulator [Escherichia coli]|uniref:TetR family transcriptional regulator n=1 Tax=Escherichia coli TaxID=562 RepID=A0A377E589_ECOLX|nr:TetR family transcriptional regulator [Escherichia coli]
MESALADYFAAIANCFTSKDTPAGCFMINNCTTLSPDSGDIANTLKSRHAMQERTLQQFYVNDKRAGEIPTHCDVTHLAEFLNCIIQGMSISAREGASLEKTNADCRNDFAFMARTGEISRKKSPSA